MSDELRITIADDHPVFRRGLRQSVEEGDGLKVIGEAGDGKAALNMIRDLNPDIAILDISMPGMDGLAVAREVMNGNPRVKLVVMTAHGDETLFQQAMALGVQGYVLKEGSLGEIVTCIRAVAEGKNFTSPAVTTYLVNRSRRAAAAQEKTGLKDLTPTERRILKLIAEYKTTREIAQELFISHFTVQTHRRNICEKLNLHGSNALVKFALAHTADLS